MFCLLEVAVKLASMCIEVSRYKTAAKLLATKAAAHIYTAADSGVSAGALFDSKKTCGCVNHCRLLVYIQDIIVQGFPAVLIAVMHKTAIKQESILAFIHRYK